MKVRMCLLAILLLLGLSGIVYAAPVGLTSEADAVESELWANQDFGLSVGFIADILSKRKIDIDSGEFEMNAFMGRIGLSALNRLNIYADIGSACDMEFDYVIQGETYKAEFDDGLVWGVGASALIYRWDNGLEIGMNASYRQADMELDKVTIVSTTYKRSNLSSIRDKDFKEYQGALELAWKKEYFIPYIGVKASDVEVTSQFTLNGTERNASKKNASENFGAFCGLTITPKLDFIPKCGQLAINVEGRFLDEEAITAGITYKF